jgi:ThiF family
MSIAREDVRRLATRPVTASNIRRRVNLMGVGGVGSNLVRTICRRAESFAVRIFDHDKVELHNLNRTSMFSLSSAMTHRDKVKAIQGRANALTGCNPVVAALAVETNRESEFDVGIIIDARDTLDPLKVPKRTWLKLAYDGGSDVSFTWLPAEVADKVFDLTANRRSTYEVVPSFYVPAALLGVLALRFLEFPNFLEITPLRAGTFQMNLDDLANEISYKWEAE